MKHAFPSEHSPGFLALAVCMCTCLILLINVSFKMISIQGLVFSANSLLCPVIAGFYLLTLRNCTFSEQRHVLNIALISLYLFCIGVYVLVNLPAAEYMQDNSVYQIIFEDIPKKFFATTIAFALGFYLPHLLLSTPSYNVLGSPRHCVVLALLGGLAFFLMDFFLLFSGGPHTHGFKHVFIDSSMIASLLLLLIGVSYLVFLLGEQQAKEGMAIEKKGLISPLYYYLVCFAVAVMLICLACEYRLVAFTKDIIVTGSSLFFPLTVIISTLIGERWGYKANLQFTVVLIIAQCVFDGLLMGLVALPSPPFFNLNPFYNYIMPRRLPAASLALFVTFISNAMLLHYLNQTKWSVHRALRIIIANTVANSLLCLVNYSLLFGGIFTYEQIVDLALNAWQYKLLIVVLSLPLVLGICKVLEKNNDYVFEGASTQ